MIETKTRAILSYLQDLINDYHRARNLLPDYLRNEKYN